MANKSKLKVAEEVRANEQYNDHRKGYYRINIEILKELYTIPFDVFIDRGSKLVKLFKSNSELVIQRLSGYKSKGIDDLFIEIKHRIVYNYKSEEIANRLLSDENVPMNKKVQLVHELANSAMTEVFIDCNLNNEEMTRATKSMTKVIDFISQDNRVMTAFLRTTSSDFYLAKHSIATCVLSLVLARADGNTSDKMLRTIGMGALMHDIGMAQISPEIVRKKVQDLTPEELKEYKMHPQYGYTMVRDLSSVPSEVRQVIYQHHEQPNGQGFPSFSRNNKLLYPSKIVSIANAFSELTTKFPERESHTPPKSIEIMLEQVGVFDPRLLEIFVNIINPQSDKISLE